jgi:hypothetical protein
MITAKSPAQQGLASMMHTAMFLPYRPSQAALYQVNFTFCSIASSCRASRFELVADLLCLCTYGLFVHLWLQNINK